jgi:hypothetical protein
MLMAGKNNGRFLKNKVTEKFYLVNTNNFHYYSSCITMAKNKYGGLCAPRHGAAIGPRGAGFVG